MSADMPKAYQASDHEARLYDLWERTGVFTPERLPTRHQAGAPYTIAMPPPNRTGIPHAGHATFMTIQDAYVRFWRLRGRRALWIPGTDHAAIATQIKVDKLLRAQGYKNPRAELGREKFLAEVVKFSEESGDAIRKLVRGMGSSCDWTRERFTMDEGCNEAVFEMFRRMLEDGIVERGNRIVNWDPKFQTTLSDDEVVTKEIRARLLTFKYAKAFPIAISTTRPETKFADTAVAVHPDDGRYKAYVGQTIETTFCGKRIVVRVIADEAVDPAFGTGALGVTPAHSGIDWDLAEKHGLPMEQAIGRDGKLLPACGDFAGLAIDEARKKIEERLAADGLLEKVEEVQQNLPMSERGEVPVEQLPMEQWWVRVNKPFALRQNTLGKWKKGDRVTLKELMLEAVAPGKVRIVPDQFERVYKHWIENLRDWCISRQIWYGHRVPAWYKDGEVRVSREAPGEGWEQDPDTLDTWFSSGMWTFSTLGWPGNASVDADGNLVKTGDLATFHPTDLLETGRDILFFWVARMILMSTYALGEIPFKDVYLHGMVIDEQGRKMSKSLGNIVDPFDFTPSFGTDAVRLALVVGSTPGQDLRLSPTKIETARNFTNKIWNISRYILTSTAKEDEAAAPAPRTLADRWILAKAAKLEADVTRCFEEYQLSLAGELLREFVWSDLADWYLEIAKVEKEGKGPILRSLLKRVLVLMHPLMPFVTEAVWQEAGWEGVLALTAWPEVSTVAEAGDIEAFDRLRGLVTDARRLRAESGIDAAKKLAFVLVGDDAAWAAVEPSLDWLRRLLGAASLDRAASMPAGALSTATGASLVGIVQEEASADDRAKLEAEAADAERYRDDVARRLANGEFVAKAPARVVDDLRQKLAETEARLARLRARLAG